MERRPTLLGSCASAATAREASFRIDRSNATVRASRVIALDEEAEAIVRRIADGPWQAAHLLAYEGVLEGDDGTPDARLRSLDGQEATLEDELDAADLAIMISTTEAGAPGASVVGRACARRRIMTAGLVVSPGADPVLAVNALRPYAAVLVVSRDEGFIPEMLQALRA